MGCTEDCFGDNTCKKLKGEELSRGRNETATGVAGVIVGAAGSFEPGLAFRKA